MLREATGGLKATVGNSVKPDYHFIRIDFVLFCLFQPDSCDLWQYAQKHVSTYWTMWTQARLRFEEYI